MAVLASYALQAKEYTLAEYLDKYVFEGQHSVTLLASVQEIEGFRRYYESYCQALPVEKTAISHY